MQFDGLVQDRVALQGGRGHGLAVTPGSGPRLDVVGWVSGKGNHRPAPQCEPDRVSDAWNPRYRRDAWNVPLATVSRDGAGAEWTKA